MHEEQAVAAVEPVAPLYLPAPQATQSESASWSDAAPGFMALYVPTGHDVQTVLTVASAVIEYVPAPQIEQAVACEAE